MAKRKLPLPIKKTLTKALLLKVKAPKLKKLFESIFKRDKYVNKNQAAKKLLARSKRMRVKDRAKLKRSVDAHLAYYKKPRKKVASKRKTVARDKRNIILSQAKGIKFEFSRETKNFRYFRTAWIIPEGYDDMFWQVYGEATQDFVEKNPRAIFVGFKYAVLRNVGNHLVELTDDLHIYSPHFEYSDFFEPSDLPNVARWYRTIFLIAMFARLRRYFEDEFRILAYYIVVKKEDYER